VTSPSDIDTPVARALAASRAGRREEAGAIVASLVQECFGFAAAKVAVASDRYSLNSLNGLLSTEAGEEFFFKFHHEEGEEATSDEYYQAELLREAGFPVDSPVHASKAVGRQILLYRVRHDRRFADVCRGLDFGDAGAGFRAAVAAQETLDAEIGANYLKTLHASTAADCAREPIHQLFHARLIDRDRPGELGGRARRFFFDGSFDLAGRTLDAAALRAARWTVNGVEYRDSIETLLARSLALLAPVRLATGGVVVAHGDAHNANLWYEEQPGRTPRLVMFDPAFAGRHVPALLAEAKATMHNIFAHPLWLYDDAATAERFHASVELGAGRIAVETDWALSALRKAFLASKGERVWRPLLAALRDRHLLPADWRETLRAALFCCPSLVMELRAGGSGGHNPVSSVIGLAVAVSLGSEPVTPAGDDASRFLDAIDPRARSGQLLSG
jgi:hypothetical protein